MNCAQHSDRTASAFCRHCGQPLCPTCARTVQSAVYCETCLAALLNARATNVSGPPYAGPEPASPGWALALAWIPGVGAMYNGQYLKGFVHVIIFATLVWMTDHGMDVFGGLLITAWFFYMLFDAWATAKARCEGRPLPDPLGLNTLLEGRDGDFRTRLGKVGERFSDHMENASREFHRSQAAAPPAADAAPAASEPTGSHYRSPFAAADDAGKAPRKPHSPSSFGALALIACGIFFLLVNLGWFSLAWLFHFWPAILICLGLWLLIQRFFLRS